LPLRLVKPYAMKAYGEIDVEIHGFFTRHYFRFTTGERALGARWIGGWVGPRTSLDDVEKEKFLTLPGLELRPPCHPARSRLVYPLVIVYCYIQLFIQIERRFLIIL
jgi:hypothetical protein